MQSSPLSEWLLQAGSPRGMQGRTPLNRWLFESIREAIQTGRIRKGQKLPATRALAAELGVARITATQAYDRLVAEGYLVSKVGAGTFVADTEPDPIPWVAAQQAGVRRAVPTRFTPARNAQAVLNRLGASPKQVGPFTPGIPDVRHFPHALWQRLLTRAGRIRDDSIAGYGTTHGLLALRRALVDYLGLSRGVRCDADQIIITQGAHQAIDLCIRAICDPGDTVWIEDPSYWGARNLFVINSTRVRALPVDARGMRPPATSPKPRPRMIFVTPSHQYPSGVVMSLARRNLWLDLAARYGAYIVEDDYDSEFRYREAPLPSVQGLDRLGRTLYVGSFSKTLYPGLRLGFVVAPPALASTLAVLHSELYRGGQLPMQAALAEFIAGGHFASHVRKMRRLYGERQSVLAESLRARLGGAVSVPSDPAGLQLAVGLVDARDDAVSEAAAALDLVARPLSLYFRTPHTAPQGLVLGFGGIETDAIDGAVTRLARAIEFARIRLTA
jgi:GntR family transcriptional regulator/MocR family aminotransferase